MSLPQPLLGMCRTSIVVHAYAGTSSQGARAYSTSATTYSARIVGKRNVVQDVAGKNVVSNTTVYVATDVLIDPRSKVTLPSDHIPTGNSSTPPIIASTYFPDATADGLSHCRLYL